MRAWALLRNIHLVNVSFCHEERVGVGQEAFQLKYCESLSTIDLPSARIIEICAFSYSCLIEAKFGEDLESFGDETCIYFMQLAGTDIVSVPLKVVVISDDHICGREREKWK